MSFFGVYQRYSHSVLFKVLARTIRKSPKEIVFPKIVHISFNTAHAHAKTLPVGTKFQYVVLWNVPNKQLQHAVQRTTTNYSKVGERKWTFPKLSTQNTARTNTRPAATKLQYLFYFIFQRNTTIALINGCEELIKNCPKKVCFSKVVHTEQNPSNSFTSSRQIPICFI